MSRGRAEIKISSTPLYWPHVPPAAGLLSLDIPETTGRPRRFHHFRRSIITAAKSTHALILLSSQRQIVEKRTAKRGIGVVIDNINVMQSPWAKNARPGLEGIMMIGLAVFMYELPVEPEALDPAKYREASKKKGRLEMDVNAITQKLDANGNRKLLYLPVHLLSDLIADTEELSSFRIYLPGLASLRGLLSSDRGDCS